MPQTVRRHEEEHLYATPPAIPAGGALATALLRLRRAQRAQELRALHNSGLSVLDLTALRYLVQAERDERDLGHKDLTVVLGASSANITKVVDRLAEKGYLERAPHPKDRRAQYLRPTAGGVHLVDEAIGRHHAALVAAIDALGEDEARVAADAIERIVAALDDPTLLPVPPALPDPEAAM